jgi:ribosomal protein L11 methyltransferase
LGKNAWRILTISNIEHPGWLEISICIHPVAYEALSAFLFDLGCKGVITEAFQDRTIKAYLPFHKDLEKIRVRIDLFFHHLKKLFPEIRSPRLSFKKIEDQDWSGSWRKFFRPQRVTQGLMVFPAWEPVPRTIDCQVIRIDPGPAFGTGQHPTTRMCLEAMEKVRFPGIWTMLDVGTGSGILAIYGAMLGADRVVAIDIDPEAISWAKKNIKLNDLSGEIELSSRPIKKWRNSFSLLAANLILGTILDIFPDFSRVLAPGGWLILSGILKEQVKEVEESFDEYGFHKDQILYQEEWACLIAKKMDDNTE